MTLTVQWCKGLKLYTVHKALCLVEIVTSVRLDAIVGVKYVDHNITCAQLHLHNSSSLHIYNGANQLKTRNTAFER